MSIGVGVTTFRRPQYLRRAVERLNKFAGHCQVFIVNDDKDDIETVEILKESGFNYLNMPERSGIAKAKNACLRELQDCSFIFLFDDDIFIKCEGWDRLFIDAFCRTSCHHFSIVNWPVVGRWFQPGVVINSYSGSHGVCLFLTSEVLREVGGFDENMGMWGGEHVSYSRRVFKSGLTNRYGSIDAPFIGVEGSRDYFEIVDFGESDLPSIKTMTDEERAIEVAKWEHADSQLAKTGGYFIPLKENV